MDEQLLSQVPPHSLEAEQAVLGSVLIDSQCVADIIGILKPEDFYLQQNREIFEAIYEMFNYSQTIDPVTVLEKLRELGYYTEKSRDYVLQLMDITPTAAHAARYAGIVRDKAMLRGLDRAGKDIVELVAQQTGTLPRCWKAPKRRSTPCARASGATVWSISAPCYTRSSTT